MSRHRIRFLLPALLALILAGCSSVPSPAPVPTPPVAAPAVAPATPAAAPAAAAAQAGTTTTLPPMAIQGKMTLSPDHAVAGTVVTVTGTGLPAGKSMDLVWNTVEGSWNLTGSAREEYRGQVYKPVARVLGSLTTDKEGGLKTTFTVPEDFGYIHNITLMEGGVIRQQSAFSVDMAATIAPLKGPQGTQITINVKGIGSARMESPWIVLYDNKFTGWLSATTTRGTATAMIPATGGPGKHVIEIMEGPFTFAYRSIQQSPVPYLKPLTFEFTITDEKPLLPPPAVQQELPLERGQAPAGSGTAIWTDPVFATAGTPARLKGRGLPAGQSVDLIWTRVVGNRVAGQGWKESTTSLGKATVDSQGGLDLSFTVLDDLGGPHRIEARIGEQVAATTELTITPSAVWVGPTSGPVGTEFGINLHGVGWTETANIYLINYDNSYIGYTCGFNSQGNVTAYLKATGEPGWHFIDFYPGIYKGEEPIGVDMFRIPQLTYTDHPGEKLPVLRFAFHVTP